MIPLLNSHVFTQDHVDYAEVDAALEKLIARGYVCKQRSQKVI